MRLASEGVKLSAFTIIKNAILFDYPIVESMKSILPTVDEYIVNVGICNDGTKEMLEREFADEPKVKMFDSEWEGKEYGTTFFSHQTQLTLDKCEGDWVVYLQADEAIHEYDRPRIRKWIARAEAEGAQGLTLEYLHFAKNPQTVKRTYKDGFDAYDREIRVFRNDGNLFSFGDGQSFSFLEDYLDPRGPQPALHRAERFLDTDIKVYHYGYLRDGKKLLQKKRYLDGFYKVSEPGREDRIEEADGEYSFDENSLKPCNEPHPATMHDRLFV